MRLWKQLFFCCKFNFLLFNFHSLFNFHIDSSTFKLSRQNQYVNFNIVKTFYLYKMENEILESINRIKNISNKRETVEKIFTNIKKRNITITYEDLQHILEKSSYWQYIAWKREWCIKNIFDLRRFWQNSCSWYARYFGQLK